MSVWLVTSKEGEDIMKALQSFAPMVFSQTQVEAQRPKVVPTLDDLVLVVRAAEFEFPALKPYCLAQWMLESARGTSKLFLEHNNAGGMKFRKEMVGYATPVEYVAHDGLDTYCHFDSLEAWVRGYWRFIERAPYAGWRAAAQEGGEEFIKFLKLSGYAEDPEYVNNVLKLVQEAQKLLGISIPSGTPKKPKVDITSYSPNQGARLSPISGIVLHNTDGGFAGSVDWLCNPAAQASAHIIISREGKTAQLVDFDQRAWHAGNADWNNKAIGIEIEASKSAPGMTAIQETRLVEWLRWLMDEYNIPKNNVTIHRKVANTDCPSWVWPTDGDFSEWLEQKF